MPSMRNGPFRDGRRHGRPLARIYSSTEMQFKTASRSASSIG